MVEMVEMAWIPQEIVAEVYLAVALVDLVG
jgi:hypothetical protein